VADLKYRDNDATNPSHYRTGDVETIDMIREQLGDGKFIAFCQGNVLKYQDRAGHKGDADICLGKAAWYFQMALSVVDKTVQDPRLGILPRFKGNQFYKLL